MTTPSAFCSWPPGRPVCVRGQPASLLLPPAQRRQARICPAGPGPGLRPGPGPPVPCPAPRGTVARGVCVTGRADWICVAACLPKRNQKPGFIIRAQGRFPECPAAPSPPHTHAGRAGHTHVAGGAARPGGHRGGKTIPRVASKKSEVQDTAREQLSAKPAHRCSAPRAARCQTTAGPAASRHGVTRGPLSGAEARLRRAPQCRDLLCVSQNKRPSGPRAPFSLRPSTFSFSA